MTVYVPAGEKQIARKLRELGAKVTGDARADCDVALCGSEGFGGSALLCVFCGESPPRIAGAVKNAVWCGMSEKSSVNYSSIDRGRALLCVQRDIPGVLEGGEYPVEYDEGLTLDRNLMVSLVKKVIDERKEI